MIPRELIDEILARADIVDVISSYLDVKKKGRNYVAVCPFHNDTNPSLTISKEKQFFKCFVCGTSGNAIGFVQKYEHLSFIEAVKKVADIINFHDERLTNEKTVVKIDENKARLIKTINELQQFYKYSLSIEEATKANEYLASRNITPEIIAKFGIGYAPLDGEKTIKFLEAKGNSLKSIEDIGICYVNANRNSDTNAGRITFPLQDQNGQVVGFSARQIEKDGSEKYKNSPETPLFHKSDILYNYHNAKNSARHDGYCYLLEGFMDVIALDKIGIKSAVAIMGTSLTNSHIDLLRKLRCEIRICLDGDFAGLKGMMKIINQLEEAAVPFRLVNYGDDPRDPDEILQQEGSQALWDKMNNLFDALPFQLNYYQKHYHLETLEQRKALLNKFLPKLVSLGPGIEQEDYIYKLAEATSLHEKAIREMIRKATPDTNVLEVTTYDRSKLKQSTPVDKSDYLRLSSAEKTLLYYMINNKEAISFFEKEVKHFYEPIYEQIANYIIDYIRNYDDIDISGLIMDIESADESNKDELVNLVTTLGLATSYPALTQDILNKCKEIIFTERERIQYKQKVSSSSSEEQGVSALSEYVNKRREQLKKKEK